MMPSALLIVHRTSGWSEGFAAIDHLGLGNGVEIVNVSVNGRTLSTGYARRVLELYDKCWAGRLCILLIEQGTNDLAARASGQELHDAVAGLFITSAEKAGFYVLLNTILPRADAVWTAPTKGSGRSTMHASAPTAPTRTR
jgi:hypothetical protein